MGKAKEGVNACKNTAGFGTFIYRCCLFALREVQTEDAHSLIPQDAQSIAPMRNPFSRPWEGKLICELVVSLDLENQP